MEPEFLNEYIKTWDETSHTLQKENVMLKAKVSLLERKIKEIESDGITNIKTGT